MTSELREAIRGVWNKLDLVGRRVGNATDRTNVFGQLTGADYISLGALFVGWASALLFVRGEPNWALLAMFGAFALDKADGWYARRTGTSSPFGRQVDSFIDIFAYLVPAVLLYQFVLSPSVFASLVVGWNGWFAGLVICAACPLMISDYKAYKTDTSHVLAGLAAGVATGLALALQFGYL